MSHCSQMRSPRSLSLRPGQSPRWSRSRGDPPEANVTKESLRTILKGLEPTAEIVGFETIHYPVYRIVLASDHAERSLLLDGRTGKELHFPVS